MKQKEIYELDYPDFRVFVTKGFEEGYGKSATEAYEEFKQSNPDKTKEINMDMFLKITEDDYKDTIQMAVRQGKPVPENILKKFPEFEKDKSELINIKIDRKTLLNALTNIKPIVSGKHTLAILSSILITVKEDNNAIEIFATNLETGFHGIYPAKIISPGEIAIPYKELSTFISKLKSEEICISEEEKYYVKVSDDSTTCNIPCMSAEDFPLLPEEMNCEKEIEIDAVDFKDMLAKTTLINSQSENDARKMYITGISFKIIKEKKQDFLQAASTNGVVLSQVNAKISILKKAKIKENILVSKRELIKLNRVFLKNVKPQKLQKTKSKNKGFELFDKPSSEQTISLAIQDGFFIAQKQNETIEIRLLEGDFPNYQDIINRDKNKFTITANREILLDTMRQMATMQNSDYYKMQMNIEKNILKMIFTNPDTGEMKKDISVQYNGDNIETMYSPSQFVDFLSLMKSDIVNLDIIDNASPCLITEDQDKETIFVIMPCRI